MALVTLFDDAGAVDPAATATHAVRMVEAGMQAILVAGTTGEAALLTEGEQTSVADAVVAAVGGRVPVIVGVRGGDAVERAILARSAGADALLALSPPDHLHSYYADVAGVGVPVLAYHFPRVGPPGIPMDELSRLPVVGLKDSSGDFERLRLEVHGWHHPVYTGAAAIVLRAAVEGAAGALLAVTNLDPARAIAAWSGDETAQRDLDATDLVTLKGRMAERFGTSPTVRT